MSSSATDRLFVDPALDWQPVSPALVTERRIPAAVIGALGLGLICTTLLLGGAFGDDGNPVLFLTGVILVGCASVAWFVVIPRVVASWRYAERDQDLLVSRGRLRRRLSVVPYGRMQVIEVSSNPISRWLGIATVSLVTASAATDARIPGIPADVAQELRDRLAAKGEAAVAGL